MWRRSFEMTRFFQEEEEGYYRNEDQSNDPEDTIVRQYSRLTLHHPVECGKGNLVGADRINSPCHGCFFQSEQFCLRLRAVRVHMADQ